MTNIYTKLNQARKLFHEHELKKSGHNKFANYYYFELADFIIPALFIFDQLGLIGLVSFGSDIATLTIIDCDKPDDKIEFTSPMSTAALKGCHEVQNLGAVQTYLRRYLWVAALEIVEHDALDSSPKLPENGDIKGTGIKQAALKDIGAHLSADWKTYLEETAIECGRLVAQGKIEEANTEMFREPMEDEAMILYMESKMDSKTRSAMRKFNDSKGK